MRLHGLRRCLRQGGTLLVSAGIIFGSIVLSVIIFEFIAQAMLPHQHPSLFDNRFLFFKAEPDRTVFQNYSGGWTYVKSSTIDHRAFYYVDNQWVEEYSYQFRTNNLGLVQSRDALLGVPTIMLVGDSFTEGQGAAPWFNEFSETFSQSGFQVINGGLFGTGFQQWRGLINKLESQGILVSKLLVIFISNDLDRAPYMFKEADSPCLVDFSRCKGEEYFYGLPESPDDTNFRDMLLRQRTSKVDWQKKLEKFFFFSGQGIKYLKDHMALVGLTSKGRQVGENLQTLGALISRFGPNIAFVHIPTKPELIADEPNLFGVRIRQEISHRNSPLLDGFKSCGLYVDDFHQNDGHPNSSGYQKISSCVRHFIQAEWGV